MNALLLPCPCRMPATHPPSYMKQCQGIEAGVPSSGMPVIMKNETESRMAYARLLAQKTHHWSYHCLECYIAQQKQSYNGFVVAIFLFAGGFYSRRAMLGTGMACRLRRFDIEDIERRREKSEAGAATESLLLIPTS